MENTGPPDASLLRPGGHCKGSHFITAWSHHLLKKTYKDHSVKRHTRSHKYRHHLTID